MDLDGLKDIFVANGIYKDLLNQDYVNFIGNPDLVRQIILQKKTSHNLYTLTIDDNLIHALRELRYDKC
jgi:hypothetical protein